MRQKLGTQRPSLSPLATDSMAALGFSTEVSDGKMNVQASILKAQEMKGSGRKAHSVFP